MVQLRHNAKAARSDDHRYVEAREGVLLRCCWMEELQSYGLQLGAPERGGALRLDGWTAHSIHFRDMLPTLLEYVRERERVAVLPNEAISL